MEPDYSTYSITELDSTLRTIDRDAFPERTETLQTVLATRQSDAGNAAAANTQTYHANEQFFRCPACEKKIGIFSKAANKLGKKKRCPYCDSSFTSTVKFKIIVIGVIPVFLLHLLLFKPLAEAMGISSAISSGLLCGLLFVSATRFVNIRDDTR